jgi:hypothetical protein
MLGELRQWVREEAAASGGDDPMVDLFRARFPLGARLPEAAGAEPGAARALGPAATGPGWWPTRSWPDIAAAARRAGRGSFALVRPEDPAEGAIGVHVGFDGSTLWAIHVRPGAAATYRRFDGSAGSGLPHPSAAVVIDYCADVWLPQGVRL